MIRKVAVTLREILNLTNRDVKERASRCSSSTVRTDLSGLRWTYSVRCSEEYSKGPWTVVFSVKQPLTITRVTDLDDVDMYVTCDCPAFNYWGSQYHSELHDYAPPRKRRNVPPPNIRDPQGLNFLCKHVTTAAPKLSEYEVLPDIVEEPEITEEGVEAIPLEGQLYACTGRRKRWIRVYAMEELRLLRSPVLRT